MDAEEQSPWQYKHDGTAVAEPEIPQRSTTSGAAKKPPADSNMVWTASEYIEHNRGTGWYLVLAIATAGIGAGIYYWTKDIFAVVIVPIVGIVVGVFALRKPHQLTYELSVTGLKVGEKTYNYRLFKSFSIMREGGVNSLYLQPLKRLMPPLSIYYEAADEEKIIDIVGSHLPYEERRQDFMDRLTRSLRF